MIKYVLAHGGHIELWVRSAKHPAGETKLSRPLLDILETLRQEGKARLIPYPF
jgi:hypothetical protein